MVAGASGQPGGTARTASGPAARLIKLAARRPRLAAAAGGLGLLVAVAGARQWVAGIGPSKATAVVPSGASVLASAAEHDGSSSAGSTDAVLPQAASAAGESLRAWARAPISPLSRNVFAMNLEYFPSDGSKLVKTTVPAGDGFWDQLGKSLSERSEAKTSRQREVELLCLEAKQLHLQSIVMGQVPKAMVDGRLVGEGDVVANFRVVKIHGRGIQIEQKGIVLEILFK